MLCHYHRRRLNDSLNPELAEMEFFELKIGPAGAPVRNQALLAGNFRKNVEFFRAPERFGPKNNEQYVLGLEHYFGVVSVDNSSDSLTVSVDVYAVVFSSDGTSFVEKNQIDHFQAYPVPQPPTQLIRPSDPAWRYFLGTTPPPEGWKEVGYDDSTWQTACIGGEKSGIGPATNHMALWRTGIGYGDNDDCTVIPTSSDGNYDSVCTRLKFDLEDPSKIKQMILSLDFDDGFVAYINGVEVACSNVPGCLPPSQGNAQRSTFSPPDWGYNQSATPKHEARGYRKDGRADVCSNWSSGLWCQNGVPPFPGCQS